MVGARRRTTLGLVLFGILVIGARAGPEDAQRQRNLNNCVAGLRSCDISTLAPPELQQVSGVYKRRNFNNCLIGLSSCDPTVLSSQEQASAMNASKQRNLQRCLAGSPQCNPTILTAQESEERSRGAQEAQRGAVFEWRIELRSNLAER
jgi:hypothetical protein